MCAEFSLICPRCSAPPEDARLAVVSGRFSARSMPLNDDGFSPTDARGFDTDDEVVHCSMCDSRFPIGECLIGNHLVHAEELEIWGMADMGDGRLTATTEILGTNMHVTFIRVEKNSNHIQIAKHPIAQNMYTHLCMMDPGGPFRTVQLADRDGEWVMIITPFQE